MTLDLVELLNVCGSDKASGHSYGEVYAQLFDPIREGVKSVLEIGVYKGASLRAWHSYFRNAFIVGVDLKKQKECVLPPDRTAVIEADATNAGAVQAMIKAHGPFDVIFDDGSHDPGQQRKTLDLLIKQVRQGGFYVIEDVRDVKIANELARTHGGKVLDRRKIKGKWDDILVVFRAGGKR
jgi:predicted O-methyltransferase YrrM